ncbi:MAG TPA: LruC domain-containing protein, partial [Candidatus Cloacimonadota bacterium]|nr:LruC domain-containing protein [Candidatus Cloacimonadota bacterium]
MNRLPRLFIGLALVALAISACSDNGDNVYVPVADLSVSPDFNWQTAHPVEVELQVLTNAADPVPGIVFELFTQKPDMYSTPMGKGVTGADGKYNTRISLPTGVKSVWARGFMSTTEIPVIADRAAYTYGNAQAEDKSGLAPWDSKGVDFHMAPGLRSSRYGTPLPMTNEVISADFLARVNAALPEGTSIEDSHPEYLVSANQQNIKINQDAEVWITFVNEGADFRNTLGYHSFASNKPPKEVGDISSHNVIFPNASLYGSGGYLSAGNTVYLGDFDQGTTLGWFLVSNGYRQWAGGPYISTSEPVYYSSKDLNPESNDKKQHSVMIFDVQSEKFVIGFEDLNRDVDSDDDFNDLVFYVTVVPLSAVDMTNVVSIGGVTDQDGDGIADVDDDYPEDGSLAFNNPVYPTDALGTMAFEDLWPEAGDYDFNDMVIDYNVNQITNASNEVKKVEMSFKLRAIGANKDNGFAVELPFGSAQIYDVNASLPQFFAHETGDKAVLRFFENTNDLIPSDVLVNTVPGSPFRAPVEFSVSFKLHTPVALSAITQAPPYNPFIFVNEVRSHEIHLSGYAPTPRMNMSLFGTGGDASTPGNWYKSVDNLPWGVNIP